MRKNILLAYLTSVLIVCTAHLYAATAVTIYADDSYPPYSYLEDGEVKGVYYEVLKTAFSRMPEYKVTVRAIPWKRGLQLLERGSAFALYPPYYHYSSRPYIWPYSLPIIDEKVVVYCHRDILKNQQRKIWPEDYYGLTIGINAGFHLGGKKFWSAVETDKINVMEVRGNREGLLTLTRKRIDCYMNDRLSIVIELKLLKASGEYWQGGTSAELIEGATVTLEQGFLGYTDRDRGEFHFKAHFQRQLDTQIYNMRRSGELQSIVDNYILNMSLQR